MIAAVISVRVFMKNSMQASVVSLINM